MNFKHLYPHEIRALQAGCHDDPNDPQASRLYAAQYTTLDANLGRMATHIEVKAFLTHTLRNPEVQRLFGPWLKKTFQLGSTHSESASSAVLENIWSGEIIERIDIPPDYREPMVVLHELAHLIENRRKRDRPGHGWAFAQTFLALVTLVLGPAPGERLRASFDRFGVKYAEPQTYRRAA